MLFFKYVGNGHYILLQDFMDNYVDLTKATYVRKDKPEEYKCTINSETLHKLDNMGNSKEALDLVHSVLRRAIVQIGDHVHAGIKRKKAAKFYKKFTTVLSDGNLTLQRICDIIEINPSTVDDSLNFTAYEKITNVASAVVDNIVKVFNFTTCSSKTKTTTILPLIYRTGYKLVKYSEEFLINIDYWIDDMTTDELINAGVLEKLSESVLEWDKITQALIPDDTVKVIGVKVTNRDHPYLNVTPVYTKL